MLVQHHHQQDDSLVADIWQFTIGLSLAGTQAYRRFSGASCNAKTTHKTVSHLPNHLWLSSPTILSVSKMQKYLLQTSYHAAPPLSPAFTSADRNRKTNIMKINTIILWHHQPQALPSLCCAKNSPQRHFLKPDIVLLHGSLLLCPPFLFPDIT